ncbi:hypothetical protein B1218_35230, partial [Pseudomonas ogarae]
VYRARGYAKSQVDESPATDALCDHTASSVQELHYRLQERWGSKPVAALMCWWRIGVGLASVTGSRTRGAAEGAGPRYAGRGARLWREWGVA